MTDALKATTPGDREIAVERAFDAPRDLIFDAFTRPELVRRWLLGPPGWSMPVCEIDLRVGGEFRYWWQNDSDERNKNLAGFGMVGTFREIERPGRIVHVEKFEAGMMRGEAVVTTVFTERSGRTIMTMTMLFPSREARDGAIATGMTSGMEQSYERLDGILAATPPGAA